MKDTQAFCKVPYSEVKWTAARLLWFYQKVVFSTSVRLWHVDLGRSNNWERRLTLYCLGKCKFKRDITVQCWGAANISNFESRLVSLWPSFSAHSQSLHLCLTLSSPLLGLARTSLSFILILFHATSFSCGVLIHHHSALLTAPTSHLHATQPLPLHTLPLVWITSWPETDRRPCCWHTPLWLNSLCDLVKHSSRRYLFIASWLRHKERKKTHLLNHSIKLCWDL